MRIKLALVICLLAAAAMPAFGQRSNSPKSTVEAFYKYDRSHSQIFNRRNIDARKQWFSTELYRLLLNELKRDAAYLKKNPTDKPFFGDGLPFQPLQEKCEQGRDRTLVVEQDFVRRDRAAATATFSYPKPCSDPMPVVYTIGLLKTKSGWVIDDINYGEDTTLKQRLRRKEY
jgi:hypothetical protein